MNNTKEAKELKPNQDLKINSGLMRMWKKAGLQVKSFKATKKGHNEIWAGEFKTKNAILQMSVNKFGFVFYHAGNKSVNIGRLDKQNKIIDWMKAIIRNAPWAESVNEASLPSNIQRWISARGPKPAKDVKMINTWVKKLTGRGIVAGVSIGKNYNTLVLDIEYQDAAIHYDTTSGEIKLYKKKIRNFNDFKKVFQSNESVNEGIYTVYFDMGSPGLMSKTIEAKDKKDAAKKVASGLSGKFKIVKVIESVTERKFHHKKRGDNYIGGYNDNKGNNSELWGAKDGTFYIWVQKKGGAAAYIDLPKNIKDRTKADKIHHKLTRDFKKESVNEKIERGNEVHAETKKELKAAIARSMKEILAGKLPKYDIINGMTGEMIGWKEGQNEYHWQVTAIPYAERELK